MPAIEKERKRWSNDGKREKRNTVKTGKRGTANNSKSPLLFFKTNNNYNNIM